MLFAISGVITRHPQMAHRVRLPSVTNSRSQVHKPSHRIDNKMACHRHVNCHCTIAYQTHLMHSFKFLNSPSFYLSLYAKMVILLSQQEKYSTCIFIEYARCITWIKNSAQSEANFFVWLWCVTTDLQQIPSSILQENAARYEVYLTVRWFILCYEQRAPTWINTRITRF